MYDLADPSSFISVPSIGSRSPTMFSFSPRNGWVSIGEFGIAVVVGFWDPATGRLTTLPYNRDLATEGISYGLEGGGFTPDGYFLIARRGYPTAPEAQPAATGLEFPLEACGFALLDVETNRIFHLPNMTAEECYSAERIVQSSGDWPKVLSDDGRFVVGDNGFDGRLDVWGVDPSQPAIVPECFGEC